MRILIWPLLVTTAVATACWYAGGPLLTGRVLLLAIFEVSMSIDNAVIDAGVLRRMSAVWQRVYLTAGIAFAVFGMRFVLPLTCVSVIAGVPPQQAVALSVHDPDLYRQIIDAATSVLFPFGAAYLLMIFLGFIFEAHELTWLRPVERLLVRVGRIGNMAVLVTLLALSLLAYAVPEHRLIVLASGLGGVITYLIVNGIGEALTGSSEEDGAAPKGAGRATGRSAFFLFLYLEILDASFSLDGVIGAFAISTDLLVIAAGLGVGAAFVRSLTVHLVRRGVLSAYVYLEHGAHWAIGALAINMLIRLKYPVDGDVTGLIGVAFIGASLLSSAWARRYRPDHARPRRRTSRVAGQQREETPMELPPPVRQADDRFELLDTDGNGYLEREDYEALAERIAEGFGESTSSPKGMALLDGSLALWRELLRYTDIDGDERISRTEFREAALQGRLRRWNIPDETITPAAHAVLQLCDVNGDGELDQGEVARLLALCDLSADRIPEIFAEVDVDGSGKLSVDEIADAIHRLLTLDPAPV